VGGQNSQGPLGRMIDIYFFNKHKCTCVKIEILMALATIKKGKAKQTPHKKMCEVCAKTTNVARHALRSWKSTHTHISTKEESTVKAKKAGKRKKGKAYRGRKGRLRWHIRAISCCLLGREICIRNHFKCFRLNTQINRKGFPMNAYECPGKPLLMLLFTTSVHV